MGAFVSNNMNSLAFPFQIRSSTQPSYFGFNNQPRILIWVPASSQFSDCTNFNHMMQIAGPVNKNAFEYFTSGGALCYTPPQSMPQHPPGFQHPTSTPVYAPVQSIPADTTDPSSSSSKHVMLEELAANFSMNRRDPLIERKLTQFNGDSFLLNFWLGQFRSKVGSAHMTNDVKLTYLKPLVTGKA